MSHFSVEDLSFRAIQWFSHSYTELITDRVCSQSQSCLPESRALGPSHPPSMKSGSVLPNTLGDTFPLRCPAWVPHTIPTPPKNLLFPFSIDTIWTKWLCLHSPFHVPERLLCLLSCKKRRKVINRDDVQKFKSPDSQAHTWVNAPLSVVKLQMSLVVKWGKRAKPPTPFHYHY